MNAFNKDPLVMAQRPPLARSELEVARILWDLHEATVRQVMEALPEDRRLDFKTVQTYLRRLKTKGYVRTHREGRGHVYSPTVCPRHVIGEMVDDFIARLFDGEALPLFQHLINHRGLSDEELDQLQENLDRLRDREP